MRHFLNVHSANLRNEGVMMKLLEEFDGEPTFTLQNEIIYQDL